MNVVRLQSGGVITNYSCTSRCGHCLYNCGSKRDKAYLGGKMAEKIFRKIKSMGCRSVHIGGGEPLLQPDKLQVVLKAASECGMDIEYVETNSSWFTDMAPAVRILHNLQNNGVLTLLVSISPFHNEYIAFDRVQGVIEACRKTGMNVFPWVSDFAGDLAVFSPNKSHAMSEFEGKFGKDYLVKILNRYWVHMGGRALETYRSVLAEKSYKIILSENPGNCLRELSDTSHFHFDLYGNYIPGLCAGLSIEMNDLGKPLDKEKYSVLAVLSEEGISGLVDYAATKFEYKPAKEKYINKCDLCMEVRTHLIKESVFKIIWPDLCPSEFYSEI
jgi:Radical SAM superfamily